MLCLLSYLKGKLLGDNRKVIIIVVMVHNLSTKKKKKQLRGTQNEVHLK